MIFLLKLLIDIMFVVEKKEIYYSNFDEIIKGLVEKEYNKITFINCEINHFPEEFLLNNVCFKYCQIKIHSFDFIGDNISFSKCNFLKKKFYIQQSSNITIRKSTLQKLKIIKNEDKKLN